MTTVILTMTAIITVWVYAIGFVEPTAGPNDSDQDFLQNILGANNADNDFDSSNVVANKDGSIIERLEYIELSAKEKSLLGIGVFPGFRDFFNTVANDADPNTTNWTVIENTGAVTVQNDTDAVPGYLKCYVGAGAGNDAMAHTKDKRVFSIKNDVTTIHLKVKAKFDWTDDTSAQCGIGFIENDYLVNV